MGMLEDALREYAAFEDRINDPATPSADTGLLYIKNGKVHSIDDAGTVTEYGSGGGGGGGAILQVVTAVSTVDDATTATTMQNSSLAATITPQAADSTLLIRVDGEVTIRATGSTTNRRGWVGIYNETDAVNVAEQIRGRQLTANSSADAYSQLGVGLQGRYTVDDLTARTFRLRYAALAASVEVTLSGVRVGGILITIMEVAA